MVITLYENAIMIANNQQHEVVNIDNYKAHFRGNAAYGGIYMFDVSKDGKKIITVRTNNLVVIDNRTEY